MLEQFVRRRVPAPEVEDLVQTVLCDALGAERIPNDRVEIRKWLVGIARHKVADFHRRSGRERPSELGELEAEPAPVEERQLVEWAEQQAHSTGDARQTLEWMAREGEGEKLASIAAEAKVAPTQVRQRVSRMRRWMKERWLAELAAAAAVLLLSLVLWRWLTEPEIRPDDIRPDKVASSPPPMPAPMERARALRAEASAACERGEWQPCLDRLDDAARLDPAGDSSLDVAALRTRARAELSPEPAPTATDTLPPDAKELPPDTSSRPPKAPRTHGTATPTSPAPAPTEPDGSSFKGETPPGPSAAASPSSTELPSKKTKGAKPGPKPTAPTGTSGSKKSSTWSDDPIEP
jgi:DNA-directed RNA polymerase specialized sigma24 family protein